MAVVGIVGDDHRGVIPKWAIFAPIFVPLFMKLNVGPEVVLAAYRVADSPPNVITPLMPYFGLIVVFAQRYQKEAGVGTVVAMMLPYYVGVLSFGLFSWLLGFCWGFLWGEVNVHMFRDGHEDCATVHHWPLAAILLVLASSMPGLAEGA